MLLLLFSFLMENLEIQNQEAFEFFTEQKIRSELNIEKWSIWQPSQSRGKPEARTITREITLANGNKVNAKVEIGFTHKGELTTLDQKVFYALIKIWEEKGKSKSYTYISLKKIAKILNVSWGSGAIKNLTNSIERLRITPFLWEHSYFNAETKETVETTEDAFTILAERKIIKTNKDGHITREEGYFRFNELILGNLLSNYTKPVLIDVVISFKSEIAQIIYSKVDLFLSENPRYERRTKELFKDLGLEGKTYQYVSKRKEKLQLALAELLGKPLSNGGIIGKANLEPTKDGTDLKVVFEKRTRLKILPKLEKHKTTQPETEPDSIFSALRQYGVSETKAKDLIKRSRLTAEAQILYYPYITLAENVKNPSGWIIKAIENNYAPPESFKKGQTGIEARKRNDANKKAEDSKLQKELKKFEQAERKKELAKGKFESFSNERQTELFDKYKTEIIGRDYKPEHLSLSFVQGLIEQQTYNEIYKDISAGKLF